MKRDFYTALNERLAMKPDRKFDRRFWARFESELETSRRAKGPWLPRLAYLLPVGATLILALVLVKHERAVREERIAQAKVIEQTELFEKLDLFTGKVDFASVTDEQWEILLKGRGG